jgi:hypothetical protein
MAGFEYRFLLSVRKKNAYCSHACHAFLFMEGLARGMQAYHDQAVMVRERSSGSIICPRWWWVFNSFLESFTRRRLMVLVVTVVTASPAHSAACCARLHLMFCFLPRGIPSLHLPPKSCISQSVQHGRPAYSQNPVYGPHQERPALKSLSQTS